MPTRAFGDLDLKHKQFNQHKFSKEEGYYAPLKTFNGPYITHIPEIQVHSLTKEDEYLILASDGLWDEIKRKEVALIADN